MYKEISIVSKEHQTSYKFQIEKIQKQIEKKHFEKYYQKIT